MLNIIKDKLLSALKDPAIKKQIIRYLIIGFSTFILEYSLFRIIYSALGKHNEYTVWFLNNVRSENIANSGALVVIFWFNFLLNRYWSFQSKEKIGRQLSIYLLLFIFNYFFSNYSLIYAKEWFGINPEITKLVVMVFIVGWNFILYRTVIYRNKDIKKA